MITEAAVRELAGFRGQDAPVTSCYLDVDGRRLSRRADCEHELERVLRSARSRANGTTSVARDLQRIEEYVRGGIDRSTTRGLAMFSCSAHDFWQVVPLPVPVRSRVVINEAPAVSQLESVTQGFERFARAAGRSPASPHPGVPLRRAGRPLRAARRAAFATRTAAATSTGVTSPRGPTPRRPPICVGPPTWPSPCSRPMPSST